MELISAIVLSAVCALGAYILSLAFHALRHRSPLLDIPGPPEAPSWLLGYFTEFQDAEANLATKWVQEYGHVVAFRDIGRSISVYTSDLRAIQHVLIHSEEFVKSEFVRTLITRVLGESVLVAEGASHRAQRRVMNPAFGPVQVRELSGVFLDKANELRDVWTSKIDSTTGAAHLNAPEGLSAATLDIIGLAGFGYAFEAVGNPADATNELSEAFTTMIGTGADNLDYAILGALPGAQYLPTATQRGRNRARVIMNRIGRELLRERKAIAMASGKAEAGGRDLLSLLVRANMSENPAQRMTDDQVLAQIPTFILAGHETTATAISWALFELAQQPAFQLRLCEELRTLVLPCGARGNEPLDADALGELDRLPLLDAVVRETMRFHPPVQLPDRVATCDTTVPLARPFVDRHGVLRDEIRMTKGDVFIIPIPLVQLSKELWGEDADVWRPERWLDGAPEAANAVAGVWSHLLTFLGGSHACIGYRFALLEIKIILHSLLSALHFDLGVPAENVGKRSGIVIKPVLRNAPEQGVQLPLIVTRAKSDASE